MDQGSGPLAHLLITPNLSSEPVTGSLPSSTCKPAVECWNSVLHDGHEMKICKQPMSSFKIATEIKYNLQGGIQVIV